MDHKLIDTERYQKLDRISAQHVRDAISLCRQYLQLQKDIDLIIIQFGLFIKRDLSAAKIELINDFLAQGLNPEGSITVQELEQFLTRLEDAITRPVFIRS